MILYMGKRREQPYGYDMIPVLGEIPLEGIRRILEDKRFPFADPAGIRLGREDEANPNSIIGWEGTKLTGDIANIFPSPPNLFNTPEVVVYRDPEEILKWINPSRFSEVCGQESLNGRYQPGTEGTRSANRDLLAASKTDLKTQLEAYRKRRAHNSKPYAVMYESDLKPTVRYPEYGIIHTASLDSWILSAQYEGDPQAYLLVRETIREDPKDNTSNIVSDTFYTTAPCVSGGIDLALRWFEYHHDAFISALPTDWNIRLDLSGLFPGNPLSFKSPNNPLESVFNAIGKEYPDSKEEVARGISDLLSNNTYVGQGLYEKAGKGRLIGEDLSILEWAELSGRGVALAAGGSLASPSFSGIGGRITSLKEGERESFVRISPIGDSRVTIPGLHLINDSPDKYGPVLE